MPGSVTGELCPYIVHGLETEGEQQAWHVLRLSQSSLRMGPMGGYLGLDMGVVTQIAQALGYDMRKVIELIGEAQPVIVKKLNEK